jgi:hypothetical protein
MPSERFRFFVFTCRDPRTDFRLPLVDALRQNHETYYIWLRRRPVVSGPNSGDPFVEMSLGALLRFMRGIRRDGAINVYINSTNTYFPGMSALLKLASPPGIWCFDMHDDLRYHNTGLKRWREERIIAFLGRLSDVVVHAAPTLQELFPHSVHLGNASDILPVTPIADDGILIIASFDERFDFKFVSQLAAACPQMIFNLHGWTRPRDEDTTARLVALAGGRENIKYRGPYAMADLPGILKRYRVSVAPYRTDTLLTRYIDPLRFYHCLNAGLEVISTDIPQARHMRDWVHVVSDVTDCAATLAAVQRGEAARQPNYKPITWDQRAEELLAIIQALPRTRKLAARRSQTG